MSTAKLIPQSEKELREKNLALVRRYMDYMGLERTSRSELYTDDYIGGLYTKPDGNVDTNPTPGKEHKRKFDAFNTKYFPDWSHSDNVIYQTIDPNLYITTCKGFGFKIQPEEGDMFYENFFIGTFIVEGDLLKSYYEYMNPMVLRKAMGKPMPKIKRPARTYHFDTEGLE